MINNLRKKLTITNMMATSIVLIVAIIIISFTVVTRLDAIRINNMQRALAYPLQGASQKDFAADFSDVVLVVYKDGQVDELLVGKNIKNDFIQTIFEDIHSIVESGEFQGVTSLRLQYAKMQLPGGGSVKLYKKRRTLLAAVVPSEKVKTVKGFDVNRLVAL